MLHIWIQQKLISFPYMKADTVRSCRARARPIDILDRTCVPVKIICLNVSLLLQITLYFASQSKVCQVPGCHWARLFPWVNVMSQVYPGCASGKGWTRVSFTFCHGAPRPKIQTFLQSLFIEHSSFTMMLSGTGDTSELSERPVRRMTGTPFWEK